VFKTIAARVVVLTVANDVEVLTRRDGSPELGEKRHWAPSSRWLLSLRQHDRSTGARR
jgi:hypothetical protein